MPFTVQDLLSRVQPMRPDLDPGLIENMIQETAKRVMRETYTGHVVQSVVPVTGGVNEILLSSRLDYWDVTNGFPNTLQGGTNGLDFSQMIVPSAWEGSAPDAYLVLDANPQQKAPAEVLRVIRVRFAPLPISPAPANHGYLILAGPAPLPSPTGYAAGGFLVIYGSATMTDPSNGLAYKLNTGDVVYTNAVNWTVYPLQQFRTYRQINGPTLNLNSNQPKFTNTQLVNCQQWSQRAGQISTFYDSAGGTGLGSGGDVPMPPLAQTGGYTITVSPVTSIVHQGILFALSVTISRSGGFAGPIDLFIPMNVTASDAAGIYINSPINQASVSIGNWINDVSVGYLGGPGFTYVNVPDSFAINIQGVGPGLGALFGINFKILGTSSVPIVYSNTFSLVGA